MVIMLPIYLLLLVPTVIFIWSVIASVVLKGSQTSHSGSQDKPAGGDEEAMRKPHTLSNDDDGFQDLSVGVLAEIDSSGHGLLGEVLLEQQVPPELVLSLTDARDSFSKSLSDLQPVPARFCLHPLLLLVLPLASSCIQIELRGFR